MLIFRKAFNLLCILLIASGCSKGFLSDINIRNIVNPDEEPPEIVFHTDGQSMLGAHSFTLEYDITDNVRVAEAYLYFSPDRDDAEFIRLGQIPHGENQQVSFCVPNKNLPNPAFKIYAVDTSGNEARFILGQDEDDETIFHESFPIDIFAEFPVPTLSILEAPVTKYDHPTFSVTGCVAHFCDGSDLFYEEPTAVAEVGFTGRFVDNLGVYDWNWTSATPTTWMTCDESESQIFEETETSVSVFADEGMYEFRAHVRTVDTDYDDVTPLELMNVIDSTLAEVEYDITPPTNLDEEGDPIVVLGEITIIARSYARYRLSSCYDISRVFITRDNSTPPDYDVDGWQDCNDEVNTMLFVDLLPGVNDLYFYTQDAAGNVQSTPLEEDVEYIPQTFNIVGGPLINDPIADITILGIENCGQVNLHSVAFLPPGSSAPEESSTDWQSCSVEIGHFQSYELTPGLHEMEVYFKYDNGAIGPNPLLVEVIYSPSVVWDDAPVINRPQTNFSLQSCLGITHVYMTDDDGFTPDGEEAVGWEECQVSGDGSYLFDGLSVGDNTIYFWFKNEDEEIVYPSRDEAVATFTPPSSRVNSINYQEEFAYMTMNSCQGISEVLITLNDAAVPLESDPEWLPCTTASMAFQSPSFTFDGPQELRTWFKFEDDYILEDHPYLEIVDYEALDTTPPNIANITLTLENTLSLQEPYLLEDKSSRANFTLTNTCADSGDEDITAVYIIRREGGTVTDVPSVNAEGWQPCNNDTGGLRSASLPEPGQNNEHTLDVFFRNSNGFVSDAYIFTAHTDSDGDPITSTSDEGLVVRVELDDVLDEPTRPLITVTDAPILTSAPALMTPEHCDYVDQIYFTTTDTKPDAFKFGWQDCDHTTVNSLNYQMYLAGEYDLYAWFKGVSGNINDTPRIVSFIFDPSTTEVNPSSLISYWTLDSDHIFRDRAVDAFGGNHLSFSNLGDFGTEDRDGHESLRFNGTDSYLIGHGYESLRPETEISLSLWVYIPTGHTGTSGIVNMLSEEVGEDDRGYALFLNGNNLFFQINDNQLSHDISLLGGWNYITAASNGRY